MRMRGNYPNTTQFKFTVEGLAMVLRDVIGEFTVEQLEHHLSAFVEAEMYEDAAIIKSEIDKRNNLPV